MSNPFLCASLSHHENLSALRHRQRAETRALRKSFYRWNAECRPLLLALGQSLHGSTLVFQKILVNCFARTSMMSYICRGVMPYRVVADEARLSWHLFLNESAMGLFYNQYTDPLYNSPFVSVTLQSGQEGAVSRFRIHTEAGSNFPAELNRVSLVDVLTERVLHPYLERQLVDMSHAET